MCYFELKYNNPLVILRRLKLGRGPLTLSNLDSEILLKKVSSTCYLVLDVINKLQRSKCQKTLKNPFGQEIQEQNFTLPESDLFQSFSQEQIAISQKKGCRSMPERGQKVQEEETESFPNLISSTSLLCPGPVW